MEKYKYKEVLKINNMSWALDMLAKIWNQAPSSIKEAKTMAIAKKLVKNYCKTLPV